MLFIDASVAVAIITRKEEADALMDRLEKEGGPFYVSAVMKVEASISIARRLAGPGKPATSDMVATARRLVNQFIADLEARDVPIANDVANKALDAAQQFGKIVNHAARLNMGDCCAYACATASQTRVAYKGDDFIHTDIGW